MTQKFKAGDKVRAVTSGNRLIKAGETYEFVKYWSCGGNTFADVLVDGKERSQLAYRFELVSEPSFKAGDKVRVVRKVTGKTARFNNSWEGVMDDAVNDGKTYTVSRVTPQGVYFEERGYGWPPAALELVTETAAAAPSKIDLASLKKGDKVTLTMTYEVREPADEGGDVMVKAVGTGRRDYLFAVHANKYVGTVEKAAEEPLKVGDEVRLGEVGVGTIRAIHAGNAWVEPANGSAFRTYRLGILKRAA